MRVPDEFADIFARFPAALRELVEAELASGNTIAAIEHGFPAAPCGASIVLTRPAHADRRKSCGDLSYYARNHPAYAGEFTTPERHFFVLEPPAPPAPPPDMDAIRRAQEPTEDALTRLAQRTTGSGVQIAIGNSLQTTASTAEAREQDGSASDARPATIPLTATATGVTRLLHFQDKRPPHEVVFALERLLMALFVPSMENGCLTMRTEAAVVGCRYSFELRFEAAIASHNCYSLRVEASWAHQAATHHAYYRTTSDSWFGLWTRELQPASPTPANAGSADRYRALCEAALSAEAHLDTIPAIQQTILAAMKRGATFATSHKEGGTNLYWRGGRFGRTDYGDHPGQQTFASDEEFLTFLLAFFASETSKAAPAKVSDFDAWRLILRLLRGG